MHICLQDVKNVRASQKKVAKNLEKERTKLEELEAAPDKHRSNITKMEAKLATLEVCVELHVFEIKQSDWWIQCTYVTEYTPIN